MEPSKISEILDDLKNRFASRFIFSYTIAWLLFNWKITIALLWYDKTQIEAEGCKSIFEFISDQLEITSNGWEVLCAALIYTFVLPISKSIINVWDEIILVLRNWIKTKVDVNQDAKTIKSLQSKLSMINNYHYLIILFLLEFQVISAYLLHLRLLDNIFHSFPYPSPTILFLIYFQCRILSFPLIFLFDSL